MLNELRRGVRADLPMTKGAGVMTMRPGQEMIELLACDIGERPA
jgi:hypothetical protein